MSDHDVDKAGNPPEVNPDKIEIYHLKERIAKLESRLCASQGGHAMANEMLDKARAERDAAINKVANVMLKHGLATGHADTLDSLLSELDAGLSDCDAAYNRGLERAVEIATGMMNEYASPSWDDACENIAEAIRKEIK